MNTNLISQVEEQRHHVIVDSFTITWNELIGQYKEGDVEIEPSYQRAFRWSLDQQTKYIESLLLNIPTPPIFLSEKVNGTFEVIDGLQRFSTIIKFFAAEIFPEQSLSPDKQKDSVNNIEIPTILCEAPILSGLLNVSRASLPETLLRTLRYSRVQIILLKRESSALAKYNVFTRLNRAGTTLSNQEIRNCSARLFNAEFPSTLHKLANTKEIYNSINISKKESASMGVQEQILRLITFGNFTPKSQKIEDLLDETMYLGALKKIPAQDKLETKIIQTFEIIYAAFPNGEAFKFYKSGKFSGSFSPNLFDIIAVGIYSNISKCKKLQPSKIIELVTNIHAEHEAISLTGAGSNAKSKMIGRIKFGKKWFS